MSTNLIKYCVIPAGGLGSRWSPVTNYIPKVMIPLINKPTIDYIIKEAKDSGCSEIIIVIDKGKNIIKKYLQSNIYLNKDVNLHYIYKPKIRGIAEVIYLARNIIKNNFFSMIISDHPQFL